MAKYPIDKDFFPYSHFYPPVNRFTLPLMNCAISMLPKRAGKGRGLNVKKFKIPVSGNKRITGFLYEQAQAEQNSPCLIYFHGGGFVLEAAPYHYALAKEYALGTPCKVMFVRYRLAPANPFPVPFDDCFTALKWTIDNCGGLGVDKNRIAVGGDSAGGNLAACIALSARDAGLNLCGQMLVYPVIDPKMQTASMKEYTDSPMWNSRLSEKMWRYYLGKVPAADYVQPLEAELCGLPPAYIETAEFDCLRDEGLQYAAAIKEAGSDAEVYETEGTMHGFDIVLKSGVVRESIQRRIAFLQKIFSQ